jgi:tRNA(fMet)-specific endonuclease VapC
LNKTLLDTDTYSEILKAVDPNVTRNATAYRQAQGVLTLSAVTVMEVIRGFQKNQSQRKLQTFLSAVAVEEVLDFDRPAAELAGRIGGELVHVGRPIGLADTMIAATALHHGLELVTGNTKHFQRVQQIGYPLILVNWRV